MFESLLAEISAEDHAPEAVTQVTQELPKKTGDSDFFPAKAEILHDSWTVHFENGKKATLVKVGVPISREAAISRAERQFPGMRIKAIYTAFEPAPEKRPGIDLAPPEEGDEVKTEFIYWQKLTPEQRSGIIPTIKAGDPVRIYSEVLGEIVWWVRDEQ